MALFQIDPKPCDIDQQTDDSNREEFNLQMGSQYFQQQFDFGFQHGTDQQQFHQSTLLLLFAFAALAYKYSFFVFFFLSGVDEVRRKYLYSVHCVANIQLCFFLKSHKTWTTGKYLSRSHLSDKCPYFFDLDSWRCHMKC